MFEFFKPKQEKEKPVGQEFADLARQAYEDNLRALEASSSDS